MAKFHVVPKGDAIHHNTRGEKCPCQVEVRTWPTSDGDVDTWYYHRTVPLDEAIFATVPLSKAA